MVMSSHVALGTSDGGTCGYGGSGGGGNECVVIVMGVVMMAMNED